MIVSELIEWLKLQDQGAIIEVVKHSRGGGYYDQGGNSNVVDFNPEEYGEYKDFRGNQYNKPEDPWYNKRFLLLGMING